MTLVTFDMKIEPRKFKCRMATTVKSLNCGDRDLAKVCVVLNIYRLILFPAALSVITMRQAM